MKNIPHPKLYRERMRKVKEVDDSGAEEGICAEWKSFVSFLSAEK